MANIKLTELSELLSVDNANTILYAADLSVSPNVSHYIKVGTIGTLTDYSIANAAFLQANTAFSVGYNANVALNLAQQSFSKANTAHNQSNVATSTSTSAFNTANSGIVLAQSGYNRANLAFAHASSAYNFSNTISISTSSAFAKANDSFVHANSAYNLANSFNISSTNILAQSAFNRANNSVLKTGDTITGIVTAPTASNGTSNTMIATTQFVGNSISNIPIVGLGYGQTWQNLTNVRNSGVTYTNNGQTPIFVHVRAGSLTTNSNLYGSYIKAVVNGVEVDMDRDNGSASANRLYLSVNFIVPPGNTYKVDSFNNLDSPTTAILLQYWSELR